MNPIEKRNILNYFDSMNDPEKMGWDIWKQVNPICTLFHKILDDRDFSEEILIKDLTRQEQAFIRGCEANYQFDTEDLYLCFCLDLNHMTISEYAIREIADEERRKWFEYFRFANGF